MKGRGVKYFLTLSSRKRSGSNSSAGMGLDLACWDTREKLTIWPPKVFPTVHYHYRIWRSERYDKPWFQRTWNKSRTWFLLGYISVFRWDQVMAKLCPLQKSYGFYRRLNNAWNCWSKTFLTVHSWDWTTNLWADIISRKNGINLHRGENTKCLCKRTLLRTPATKALSGRTVNNRSQEFHVPNVVVSRWTSGTDVS